jgi:hypothetical protein
VRQIGRERAKHPVLNISKLTSALTFIQLNEKQRVRNSVRQERYNKPVRVAARSKAWTVFPRSNAGIVGSTLISVLYVCLFCVGRGLVTG